MNQKQAEDRSRGRRHAPGVNIGFIGLVAIMIVTGAMLYNGMESPHIPAFLFVLSGWLISLCLHEFGHALTAYCGGDHEIASTGYLTLDPLAYTHPVYSLLMPALFIVLGFIALPGGAVYVRTSALRSRHWDCAVSAAGPLMTFLCLCALCMPFSLGWYQEGGSPPFWAALAVLAGFLALSLIWNLLPIPGLDGWGIIEPYLGPGVQSASRQWRQVGPMLLVGLVIMFRPLGAFIMDFAIKIIVNFDVPLQFFGLGWRLFSLWR